MSAPDQAKMELKAQKASNLKVKVFGRRRTAEIDGLTQGDKFTATEFHNPKSAVVFLVVVAAVLGMAVYTATSGKVSFVLDVKHLLSETFYYTMAISVGLALLWFAALVALPGPVFFLSVGGPPVLFMACGGYMASLDPALRISGIFMALCGAAGVAVLFFWWKKVLFTKNLVAAATQVLVQHWSLVPLGAAQFLVSLGWSAACFVGAIGVFIMASNGKEAPSVWIGVPMLLPWFWGQNVTNNVYMVICAGTMGRVYFGAPNGVGEDLKNACTLSFGSISLGALLIAIVQVIKAVLEMLLSSLDDSGGGQVLHLMCSCVFDTLEWLAMVFNKYTMALVGIYHMSFENSGYHASNLIYNNGLQVLVTDDMLGYLTFSGSLVIGGGAWGIGWHSFVAGPWLYSESLLLQHADSGTDFDYLAAHGPAAYNELFHLQRTQLLGTCLGAVAGMLLWTILCFAIDALTTTLVVCYCEDPRPMQAVSATLAQTLDEKKALLTAEESGQAPA